MEINAPVQNYLSSVVPNGNCAGSGGPAGSGGGSSSGSSGAADLRDYYTAAYPLLSVHHAHGHPLHESAPASLTPNHNPTSSSNGGVIKGGPEDEWKNIHVMLNCILSMVEKTKRALAILQNRTFHTEAEGGAGGNNASNSSWLRRPHSAFPQMENSEDFKRQAGEMIAQALRATEDRVAEVKRRAEEAVQEVKRQALVELQRAEARACEVVAAERARLERVLIDSRRNPTESVIVGASMDSETCWNCGRKAHETCSGCNMARYCSAFCQHKDWENHHSACGRSNSSSTERASGASDTKNSHIHESSNSSPINVSHPSPDNHSSGSNN
ncbi:unnamed protein product [Allacma fusca]|uniref:MYND-type domain-containing protein n=1 Tax=Allacma fusca TaxID=39272 RepID=A0A8J2JJX7_9HEXA|nr:unnamed protein product [Allacma fusca]